MAVVNVIGNLSIFLVIMNYILTRMVKVNRTNKSIFFFEVHKLAFFVCTKTRKVDGSNGIP